MIRINKIYWPLQILGWSAYGALLVMFTYLTKTDNLSSVFLLKIVINVTMAIGLTHLMRSIIVYRNWLDLNLLPVLPRIIFLSFIIAGLLVASTRTISFFLNSISTGEDTFQLSRIIVDWMANLILVLFWNSIYFSYAFFRKYYFQEINNLTVESSLRETELKNLKSQLNPHFLFNSLNSIKALIEIDANKAKESLTILSSILRSSLLVEHKGMISLAKEIDLVKNYLKLEKMRFEERLIVEWSVIENPESFKIPPFVLQTMVENSVKHGISNLVDGGILRIVIKNNEQGLIIQVKNTGQINSNEETFGIGIENAKRRLDLQYKNKASMLLYEEEDMVVSQVLLKN